MHVRRIPLAGAHNVRDLGGYPTADGGLTKWGLVYRADALSDLTEADWAALTTRGVRTVLDLRSVPETMAKPVRAPAGMRYAQFSLLREMDALPAPQALAASAAHKMGLDRLLESMRPDYHKILFDNLACCAQVMEAILAGLAQGAVIFHCSAGKDRTGIIAALLLDLCGVGREDIIADYMVSSVYNERGVNKTMQALFHKLSALLPDADALKQAMASSPETMAALLTAMRARDVWQALAGQGFAGACQAALAQALVQAPSEG